MMYGRMRSFTIPVAQSMSLFQVKIDLQMTQRSRVYV